MEVTDKDYQQEEITFNPVKANINALLLALPVALAFGIPYWLIWQHKYTLVNLKYYLAANKAALIYVGPVFFAVMIAGIVMHELIHGIVFARYASKGFKSVKFGVLWAMITPYCHCKEPLTVKQFIIAGIMPAVVLGFIPSLIAIAVGKFFILLFGLTFTVAAAGDFMIVNALRKEPMDNLVQDHPGKIGFILFRKR